MVHNFTFHHWYCMRTISKYVLFCIVCAPSSYYALWVPFVFLQYLMFMFFICDSSYMWFLESISFLLIPSNPRSYLYLEYFLFYWNICVNSKRVQILNSCTGAYIGTPSQIDLYWFTQLRLGSIIFAIR